MHGVVGRRHAIVDNGLDDGVIVSRDAGEATGIIIDAIGTMYTIGAAGNCDGGELQCVNVACSRRPKTSDVRVYLEMSYGSKSDKFPIPRP